jgi:type II secretory pathway pseudopilin PulG
MKTIKYVFPLFLLTAAAPPLPAQVDSIVRALVDHAANQARQAPQQQQQQPRRTQQQRQTTTRESSSHSSKRPFDGTWLATQSKVNPQGQQMISRTFTMIIKDGKATKTLDTSNASSPEKPFYASIYELQRRWTYSSIECTEQGTSLTIQWTGGQLADWAPKTIPNPVIEGFGAPIAETSVYKLKGDELTRINDPNGVVYHRAK